MIRYGIRRKPAGRKPEVMYINVAGAVDWTEVDKDATLWMNETKARNILAAQTAAADQAEIYPVDDGKK